jgi:hypothetical protein
MSADNAAVAVDDLPVIRAGPVATVHLLRQPPGGTPAAVKVFPGPMDRFTRSAFDAERSVLGALRHVRSILQVDAVLEGPDGRPALRMELCAQSLGQLLETHGPLSVPDALAIGQAVATALAAAHPAGVVHGAVNPHNVLLRADGEPVLADFGLALRRCYRRQPGWAAGWTAPETARHDELTVLTDLYGLGAVVFTALAGHPPRGEEPELDRQDVPEPVRALVSRLLAADPAHRPPDAASALAALMAAGGAAGGAPDAGPGTADPAGEEPGGLGGFDDFAGGVDRAAARRPADRFFAEWDNGVDPVAAPEADRPARARRGTAVGFAAAVAVLVAVPVLVERQPPAPFESAGRTVASAPRDGTEGFTVRTVELVLEPPVETGDAVELTWHSDADLEYAVVVAGESLPTRVTMVGPQRTVLVPVEPDRRYCFLVQGTDGVHVYQTPPRPIRGAVCRP